MSMTTDPGTRLQSDRESCVDYCPNAACACRIRAIAGCSLPLADDAVGIEPLADDAVGIEPLADDAVGIEPEPPAPERRWRRP